MIVCTKCGHRNEDGATFCANPACGAFLEWDGQSTGVTQRPEQPRQPLRQPSGERGETREPPRQGVRAGLAEASVGVEVGGEQAVTLQVRNTGTIVEEFVIDVLGQPAAWASVEPKEMSLFPGAEGSARLTFRPPRDPGTPTGPVSFRVRVASRVNPDISAVESGVLIVGTFSEMSVTLVPHTATGRFRTKHRLTLVNAGNVLVVARVAANDPDQALRFQVTPPLLQVPPGAQAVANVLARPSKRVWLGTPVNHPFHVIVEPREAPPLRADGAMAQSPLIPRGVIATVAAAGAAALLIGAVAFLRGGGETEPRSAQGPGAVPPGAATTAAPTSATPSPSKQPEKSPEQKPTQPPSPPPPAVKVHSQGQLEIRQTFLADLDEGAEISEGADIWFEADTATDRFVTPQHAARIAAPGTVVGSLDQSSFEQCKNVPLGDERIPVQDLPEGSLLCLLTNEGRRTVVRVDQPPGPSPGTLGISFITAEK